MKRHSDTQIGKPALGDRRFPAVRNLRGEHSPDNFVAVILAAGEGRSLFPLTKSRPKALLPVAGTTILGRLTRQLAALGIKKIVVVAGYQADKVVLEIQGIRRETGLQVEVVLNTRYALTNTLYSLSLSENLCSGAGVIIVDGDVVCDDAVLANIVDSPHDAVLAIDSRRVMGEEEVKVSLSCNDRVKAVGKEVCGTAEFLGVSKFSSRIAISLFAAARRLLAAGNESAFYESAFNLLLEGSHRASTVDVAGKRWTEVDFVTDYEEALRLFGSPKQLREYLTSRRSRKQYLFCPGPVLISPKVRASLGASEIGHRELEFSELLNRVRLKLGLVYGVRNFHAYSTVVLTGSGSAANEAVLGTAGIGKHLLILSNGEFGDRLIELATRLDLRFQPLRIRWGQNLSLREIELALRTESIDAVCMVHHETSTGMLNPLEKVAALTRRYGKQLFVDAVSSLGASPVNVEDNGITFCTGSANKAIASVPGLSFVCGKREAFSQLSTVRSRSMYLDLYRHFTYNDRSFQTPNTPAVNLFFALDAALNAILENGLEVTFERYKGLAEQIREGLKRLGFRFFIPEEQMCSVLTSVELPTGFSADEFHDKLKRLGYVTYPGKGILRDRIFQVANIGELGARQVRDFLHAVAKVQDDVGNKDSRHPSRRTWGTTSAANGQNAQTIDFYRRRASDRTDVA